MVKNDSNIIQADDQILVTGGSGFIGRRVVAALIERGFSRVRCLVRPSTNPESINHLEKLGAEVVSGNLLSTADCERAVRDAKVVYHLAAGRGEKFFAEAFLNSVVTTRNLLNAIVATGKVLRFVNVSSLSVYRNQQNPRGRVLDEESPIEDKPHLRGDAYSYAKIKQDQLVDSYRQKFQLPCVTVRPGVVYGPGNEQIHGRVGIGTFGLFLHLGGRNRLPLTFVDNCADAIALAGLQPGIEGQVINIIDDDSLTSRDFLSAYKREVKNFKSIYLPQPMSYALCWLWERYSSWSHGQLPPVYNRRLWHVVWKPTDYSNAKMKTLLGWVPRVSPKQALAQHFASCRRKLAKA